MLFYVWLDAFCHVLGYLYKCCCCCCCCLVCALQETWEELVFVCPHQNFYQRVLQHQPRSRVPLSVEGYLHPPSEADDLAAIQEARRKVAMISANLRAQLQQPMVDSPTAQHSMLM